MALIGDTPNQKQINELFDTKNIDATATEFAKLSEGYRLGELSEKIIFPKLPDPTSALTIWYKSIFEYYKRVRGKRTNAAEEIEDAIVDALTSNPRKTITFRWTGTGKRRVTVTPLTNPDRYEVVIEGNFPAPH